MVKRSRDETFFDFVKIRICAVVRVVAAISVPEELNNERGCLNVIE